MSNTDYVQNFINYLYEVKSSEMLSGINKENLEVFYREYLNYIKKINNSSITEEQIYMVDRTSIFNAICYIVNNYSDDMTALQQKYSEWERTGQWSTLIVYHKLSIKSDVDRCTFITEVDRDGCYPDEEIGGVIVNYGKQTYINYYELKDLIYPILSSDSYCCKLMELIEDRFNDTKVLMDTDVNELLDSIKKKSPRKVKRL